MRRTFPALISGLLLVGAAAAPAMAQDAAPAPDRIELPNGWAPEGITALDDMLYVGSLADGAIYRADPATGQGSVLVPGVRGSAAVGVEAEAANGRLWVAGGRTGEVRAYDAETGELLETYEFDAGFLNDVVATPEAIFVTDSFKPQLAVIPLRADGGLRSRGKATTLPISGDLVYIDGSFNTNGIVTTDAGLIVVQSQPGALFRIDPETGDSSSIDVGDAELQWGDGLELDGSTLYVVRNQFDAVATLELDQAVETATLAAVLTSDDLDIPATAALLDGGLWAANARFGTSATPQTEYWLTRLETSTDAGG